jgi:hypothetical protein
MDQVARWIPVGAKRGETIRASRGSFIHGAYPGLGDNAVVVWCCGEASLFGEVSPFPAAGPRIH